MPISEDHIYDACSGNVPESFQDLDQVQDRIEFFLKENLPLCVSYLPGMVDGSVKLKGEKDLAVSLCKRLKALAHDKAVLFTFFNEDPDAGGRSRTNDMSVGSAVGMALLKVGAYYYDCEDQLYIIEAKRLPTPTRAGQGDQERQYVVSHWDRHKSSNKHRTGGIERFKEGLHGIFFSRSAMIAFVQRETVNFWMAKVNSWIHELIANPIPCHKAKWISDDLLCQIEEEGAVPVLSQFTSKHSRTNGAKPIFLRHYWLTLN